MREGHGHVCKKVVLVGYGYGYGKENLTCLVARWTGRLLDEQAQAAAPRSRSLDGADEKKISADLDICLSEKK